MSNNYDIAIIGAGPGGYCAAIRASQLGANVVLIDKAYPGGTCLNKGCIPTKSIIASADKFVALKKYSKFGINVDNADFDYEIISKRKNQIIEKTRKNLLQLFSSNNIEFITGSAKLKNENTIIIDDSSEITFRDLILATGSKPATVPSIEIDHEFIINSDDILTFEKLPESTLIVGSGAIGVEWARILSNFNKKVYVVEIADSIAPGFDEAISQRLGRLFKRQKIDFSTNTTISKIENNKVFLSNGKVLEPEKILVAAGRTPSLDDLGIENVGLKMNGKFVDINKNLKTNIENIYAIGDISGKMQLAHCASHQGISAVEHILLKKNSEIDYEKIPAIIYGKPEIASIGKTEQMLKNEAISYKASNVPLTVSGKAIVDDEIDGFVKILSVGEKIVGAHIIANEASAMIQQIAVAMNSDVSYEKFLMTVFAHPTTSEVIHEALLNLNDLAIHIPKTGR